MDTIQAIVDVRRMLVHIQVRTWPAGQDLLRARLSACPQSPRVAVDLLEAVARWQGQQVHAAVFAENPDGSSVESLFPGMQFEPVVSPLLNVDIMRRHDFGSVLRLRRYRGGGGAR